MEIRAALEVCRTPSNLRRTLKIALVVGIVLTLINQADVLIEGKASALTAVKIFLNFCVPFVVSNLGVLAGNSTARG
jgi:thiamine transporter ThiT